MSTLQTDNPDTTSSKQKADGKDLRIKQLETELAESRQELIDFKSTQKISTDKTTANVHAVQNAGKQPATAKDSKIVQEQKENAALNQADDLFEKSEAFNRSVLQTSPDCIKVLDAEGRLQYMNMNGYCLMEIDDFTLFKNKYWWDLWPEDSKPIIKNAVATALTGKKIQFQAFSFTAKGTPKWWDVIVLPMQQTKNDNEATLILSISRDITKQKQSELNEKKLLTRFQDLVMQAPVAICIFRGPQFNVEIANEQMLLFWGRAEDEVISKPVFEAMPELVGQGFEELLHNVITTGERFTATEVPVNLIRDGKMEEIFINLVYEALHEEDGAISGVMAVANVITDLVIARKRMEAQALMVHEMLMNAPAFVCTLSGPDHVYELVNPMYQQLFGTRKIQGLSIKEALPELEGQGFYELLDAVYNTGEVYLGLDVPIILGRDDTSVLETRFFNLSYQPLYDENKKIYSILVFGYEVTNQVNARNKYLEREKKLAKRLEVKVKLRTHELSEKNKELEQKNHEITLSKYNKRFLTEFSEKFSAYKLNNEFFQSLVQYIADLTRLDYVFVGRLVEKEAGTILIQTIAVTAFGKSADNFSYPLPDGPCEQVVRGTTYAYPKECQKLFPKNETIAQFHIEGYIGYPLYDERGAAVGLIAVMHEKQIEDEETVSSVLKIVARRAEIELERIKYEEQLEKNNKTLEEKNGQLEKVNLELESFSYVSSHDLQEPLRKIRTFVSRILDNESGALTEKGKEYFDRIQNAATRMQALIEDLLAYSLANVAERKLENTDMNEILEDVKSDLKEFIEEKAAIIESNHLCKANVNSSQFRQVLHNLIGNALKFSDPGKKTVISIRSQTNTGSNLKAALPALANENTGLQQFQLLPEKKYCHITFSDNGIGFEPEYGEKIFGVFQRLHGKEKYAGTGIGLAIVKKIIENHDGFITATGVLNEGAKFDIYIPVF